MVNLYPYSPTFAALWGLIVVTPSHVLAVDTNVYLNYSTYIGTAQAETGVTQWLGIRYASPPLGQLRFMPPQDPVAVSSPQLADQVSKLTHAYFRYTKPSHKHVFSMESIASPRTVRLVTRLRQKTVSSSTYTHRLLPPKPPTCQCTFSSKAAVSIRTVTRT